MARRFLIPFSVLLLFLLTLWLALSAGAPEPVQSAARRDAAAGEAAPASQPTPGAEVAEGSGERSLRVAASPTTAAPETPPVPADAKWIDIHVVDKATGAHVAGADVAWMDETTYDRVPREDGLWMQNDQEFVARTWGWRARGDARGVAAVHLAGCTEVFARDGTRYGSLQCHKNKPAPPEGYRIELVEDRTLLVQVVDARGRPAPGLFIEVAQHGADGAFQCQWGHGPAARSEQPDGRARIPHMQEWRKGSDGGEAPARAVQWRVRVDLPGGKDPGVVFDPDAPPAETVVLRLPPTGSVAARMELGGRRVPGEHHISLYAGALHDYAALNRASSQFAGADGQARFPRVALGCALVVFARLDMSVLEQEFAGPAAQDQEVTVVLTPSDDQVVLAGRVLDDHLQLLRDTELSFALAANRSTDSGTLRTDAEGRFLFCLGTAEGKEARLERFAIERYVKDARPQRALITPRDLRPGVQDVGDLVLRPSPPVVAGRFLAGAVPYPHYVVFCVERRQTGNGSDPGACWEQDRDLTTSQGGAGAFEVRGETGPGQYRLAFWARDHLPVRPVEFVPGTVDLEVQITRGEQFTATVLLPPELPGGLLAVLRPDGFGPEPIEKSVPFEHRPDRQRVAPREEEPGRYRLQWQAVAPGTYTLDLRLRGEAEPLLSIPGVKVPLAQGDGRLQDIDLRDKVAARTVRIVDAAGKLVKDASRDAFVLRRPLDPAADWLVHDVSNGIARMTVRSGPIDLLVAREGFRPREMRATRGDVDVVLEARPVVVLVFRDLPELPEGYSLEVTLRGSEPTERGCEVTRSLANRLRESMLGPTTTRKVLNGRVSLPSGDGVQRLSVTLRAASGRRGCTLRGVAPAEVSAGAATVEVRVPADAVRTAITELEKAGKGN